MKTYQELQAELAASLASLESDHQNTETLSEIDWDVDEECEEQPIEIDWD